MTHFANIIKSLGASPSTIVHLGSGACAEHALYESLQPSQIIYVEPDQYLAKSASRVIHNTPFAKVIPCAIATKNGYRQLNITNNRRFSSLLAPEKLLDFYPNIVVDQQIEVETITLEKLCREENVEIESDSLLVTELQGFENELFCTASRETLNRFKWIIIRSSEQPLYKPSAEAEACNLFEVMRKAGYRALVFDEDFPPFVNLICTRNDAEKDARRLKADKQDLLNTIRVLEHNLSKQIALVSTLRQDHRETIIGLNEALEFQKHKFDDVQNLNQLVIAERNELQSQTKELSKTIKTLKSEQLKAQNQIQSVTNENTTHQQLVANLKNELEKKSIEISEIQQTLQMNSKLALKSDADLRNLQLQYRTILQKHEQQQVVMGELKMKLHQASSYYRKLDLKNLVIESDLLDQDTPPQDVIKVDQEKEI